MLFISRYFSTTEFGVLDTDDGVEEFVDCSTLAKALDLGIEVAGAKRVTLPVCELGMVTVEPYQPVETMSVEQSKLNLLYHVDMRIYNGRITRIVWRGNEIHSPVTIRLSDYGRILGTLALRDNEVYDEIKVVLVFDDSLEFDSNSIGELCFSWSSVCGVCFDIHELTNAGKVDRLYFELAKSLNLACAESCIIDNDDRFLRMKALYWSE